MPRITLNLPDLPSHWTRTPNLLVDRLLPELKDTELRVLLVLLRQTVGWNRAGRPVMVSYRTLIARTGRQSEAIAKALAALAARRLIHIEGSLTLRKGGAHGSQTEQQHLTRKD